MVTDRYLMSIQSHCLLYNLVGVCIKLQASNSVFLPLSLFLTLVDTGIWRFLRISTACLLVILSQVYRQLIVALFVFATGQLNLNMPEALSFSLPHMLSGLVCFSCLCLRQILQAIGCKCIGNILILSSLFSPHRIYSSIDFQISVSTIFYCSTFLVGKTSHKDVKDSSNWLFKAYYGNRIFMGYCCVSCEVIIFKNP